MQDEYLAAMAAVGLPAKPSKVVRPSATGVEYLGLQLDGVRGGSVSQCPSCNGSCLRLGCSLLEAALLVVAQYLLGRSVTQRGVATDGFKQINRICHVIPLFPLMVVQQCEEAGMTRSSDVMGSSA